MRLPEESICGVRPSATSRSRTYSRAASSWPETLGIPASAIIVAVMRASSVVAVAAVLAITHPRQAYGNLLSAHKSGATAETVGAEGGRAQGAGRDQANGWAMKV